MYSARFRIFLWAWETNHRLRSRYQTPLQIKSITEPNQSQGCELSIQSRNSLYSSLLIKYSTLWSAEESASKKLCVDSALQSTESWRCPRACLTKKKQPRSSVSRVVCEKWGGGLWFLAINHSNRSWWSVREVLIEGNMNSLQPILSEQSSN